MDKSEQEFVRKASRRERNRRDYEKSKARQDQLLLRLDKGDMARLDEASKAIGVSRAAFARMFLIPTLGAVAHRMSDIDKARAERRQSLGQFLSDAIAASLIATVPCAAAPLAADEFDALFGANDGGG